MHSFIATYKKQLFIALLLAVLLCTTALSIFDTSLKNDVCTNGIVSFEMAKDLNISVDILNSWTDKAKLNAALSLGFDFLYLLVYSSFIALLIYNINHRLWKGKAFYKLGKLLIFLIFIAALFDTIENIALIKILLGDLKQIWVSIAYYFASFKFLIILLTIIYLLVNWSILIFKKASSKV